MNDKTSITAKTISRFKSFRYALIAEGICAGALSAVVVVIFRLLLERAGELLIVVEKFGRENVWFVPVWIGILLAAAAVVYRLVKWEPYISGSGIPQVEGEMSGVLKQKWWRVLSAKLIGGVLSVGAGLSLGREGPSIQLGAMTAKGFARLTKRMKTEERLIMTCGAGAGLSAAFNAPLAGVLFCLEEIHKNFSAEVILSVMSASITADFISSNVFGLEPVFAFRDVTMMPLSQYFHVIVLGLLLGFFGALYNKTTELSQNLYQKIPGYVRLAIPFAIAGALAFVCPSLLGGGHELAISLQNGTYTLLVLGMLLAGKFVFSMLSFGSGAPGGIFLPLLVLGALSGALYYSAVSSMGIAADGLLVNFIILGMAGYFSAIVRAPITGIILISEMTGTFSHLLTLSVVSLFAYIVPDLLKVKPIYEQLLERIAKKKSAASASGDTVLVEGIVCHGCEAQDMRIGELVWPETCLVVSVVRGDNEVVPNGDTRLFAGDRLVLMCSEKMLSEAKKMLDDMCGTVKKYE